MKRTKEEVIKYIADEDVRFIRLAFCDVFGTLKNIAIQPSEIERAFEYGIPIDASAIAGFGGDIRSDLFLHPDPSTLSFLPWRSENGRVIRMFCSVRYPDGRVLESDSREILARAVAAADAAGLKFKFGAKMEFYLFKNDENGEPTGVPHDKAGYMDVAPEDRGENVRREICLTLSQMGIQPESSHHEEGPGQNEIDFRYADPLTAADDAITFRSVVKAIVAKHGLTADFSPKPIPDEAGSGLHINLTVDHKDGRDVLPYTIAGLMDKIKDITVFLNPCESSYARLGVSKAPGYISWSSENRSQLIRIPSSAQRDSRAELRSPDPMANPYIAFALIIYAAIYGLENRLPLPESSDINLFTAPPKVTSRYKRLPTSLAEAARLARNSEFVRAYMPASVISAYCERQ